MVANYQYPDILTMSHGCIFGGSGYECNSSRQLHAFKIEKVTNKASRLFPKGESLNHEFDATPHSKQPILQVR